jgi:uncharacterized protein
MILFFLLLLAFNSFVVSSKPIPTVQDLRISAEKGQSWAEFSIGLHYREGTGGVEQDFSLALDWWKKAAFRGHSLAQFNLGTWYHRGDGGVKKDLVQAYIWLELSSRQWLSQAGEYFENLKKEMSAEQLKKAKRDIKGVEAKILVKLSESKGPKAQFEIARRYQRGEGIPSDPAQAVKWLLKAAKGGHSGAQFSLGFSYELGRGTPLDDVQALDWFRKAAAKGDPRACYKLGYRYFSGKGVRQNSILAWAWLQIADVGGLQAAKKTLVSLDQKLSPEQKKEAQTLVDAGILTLLNGPWEALPIPIHFETRLHGPFRELPRPSQAVGVNSPFAARYEVSFSELSDSDDALKWEQNSASQGVAEAQYRLGMRFHTGRSFTRDLAKAASWYFKAAEQEHLGALTKLGYLYIQVRRSRLPSDEPLIPDISIPSTKDSTNQSTSETPDRLYQEIFEGYREAYSRALPLFIKASEKGYAEAGYLLATLNYRGHGLSQSFAKAVAGYRKAALQGHARSQFMLGMMLVHGEGGSVAIEQGEKWLGKAADQGLHEASFCLSLLLGRKGKGQSEAALSRLRRAAKGGILRARFNLAWSLSQAGKGNLDEVFRAYHDAAKSGLVQASFNLATLEFIEADLYGSSEILGHYLEGARGNDPLAQFQVAMLYETGRGIPKNSKKALSWYRRAAIRDNLQAQAHLGSIYFEGQQGQEIDLPEAFKWWRKASLQNHALSAYNLSHLYALGHGVSRDLVRAHALLEVALVQGLDVANEASKALWPLLSKSEKEQSKALKKGGVSRILGADKVLVLDQKTTKSQPNPKKLPKSKKPQIKPATDSLLLAAKGGDPKAAYDLALEYISGKYISGKNLVGKNRKKNLKQAYHWLVKASQGSELRAFFELGRLYEAGLGAKKSIDKALDAYSRAKGVMDTAKKAWQRLILKKADDHYQRYENTEAIKLYKQALEEDAASFETLLGLTKAYNSLGLDFADAGKSKDAEKYYQKTVDVAGKIKDQFPKKGEAYLYLAIGTGNLAKSKGGKEKIKIGATVEEFCKMAIKLDPTLGMAHAVLGTYYVTIASLPWLLKAFAKTFLGALPEVTKEQALELYQRAVKEDPKLIYAWNKLGLVHKYLGNNKKAVSFYKTTLSLKPRNSQDNRTLKEAQKNLKELQ